MNTPHTLHASRLAFISGYRARGADRMRHLLCLTAIAALAAASASGQTVRTWLGGSGDFSTGSNWSGGTVPGALDDAVFTTGGAFTVSVTNNVEVLRLQFNKEGLNADLNIEPGKVCTAGTNFVVKGGTVASPTRLTLGSGTLQMKSAHNSNASGIGSGYTELVITNASLLAPSDNYFYVSSAGNYGALTIGPGGYYYGPQILTADQTPYYSNRIVVAGQNARLVCYNNAQIRCGVRGWGNATIVTNNGYLSCGPYSCGANPESRSNTLYIASGGVIEIPGANITFAIGNNGFRNRGVIDAGGRLLINVTSSSLCIGGNVVTARNSGGYGNELVVQNGGTVTNNGYTYLGGSPTNNLNALVVTNGGVFYNGQNLYIGELGRSNSVYVADGGRIDNAKDLFVGNGNSQTTSWNNRLTIGDGGTVAVNWTTYVGGSGCSNELVVATNGLMSSALNMIVGAYSSASGNVLRVAGGTVSTPGSLVMGDFGSFNRTVISDGELVCSALSIGRSTNSVGNELVLEGGTLKVTNSIPFIGNSGTNNVMTVRNTGVFSNTNYRFTVGQSASVNARLNVYTGGYVKAKGFLIGDGNFPTNAAVYVCGENARLIVGGTDTGDDLRVGALTANGSRLYACDGGVVDAGVMAVGVNYSPTATNCQLFVRDGAVYATNNQFYVQMNGVLNISGSNSLVKCRDFALKHSAAVEFEIPKFGVQTTAPLIQAERNLTLTETPSLKVTCSDWASRTGGKITLLEYASTLSGDLAALVASAQVDDSRATLSIVGKSVVLSAPKYGGTLLRIQ